MIEIIQIYKNSRKQFIQKVYFIVSIQLILTAIVTTIAMQVPAFLEFQMKNIALCWIIIAALVCIETAIFCCPAGIHHPTNIILLSIFTLGESYFVSYFCSYISFFFENGNQTGSLQGIIDNADSNVQLSMESEIYLKLINLYFMERKPVIEVVLFGRLYFYSREQ